MDLFVLFVFFFFFFLPFFYFKPHFQGKRHQRSIQKMHFLMISVAGLCVSALSSRCQAQVTSRYVPVVVVQLLSRVWLFVTPWTVANQASLSFTISRSLLRLVSIELMMPSNHLILCCPLLLLPSIFPSIRLFSSKLALCIRWPKYWSFRFSISPFSEYSVLTSFQIDWLDLLGVQGTLKSLLQHHCSKASTLWHSAFFMVQLSHPYKLLFNL